MLTKQLIIDEVSKEISTTDKGKKFFDLVINEYFHPSSSNQFIYLDGSGDGKIDGYRVCPPVNDGPTRWDIVQTKFGTSFSGVDTARSEVDGFLANVGNVSFCGKDGTFNGLRQFLKMTKDKNLPNYVKYYFITCDPVDDETCKVVKELETSFFELTGVRLYSECLSLDDLRDKNKKNTVVTFKSDFLHQQPQEKYYYRGTISFDNLYGLVTEFESQTGNRNIILNGNVRGYQGSNKINTGIIDTAQSCSEMFLVRNLGITMLSDGIVQEKDDIFILKNPQIVNGGQTTTGIMKTMDLTGGKSSNSRAFVNVDIIDTTNLSKEEIDLIKLCRNTSNPVSNGDKKSLEKEEVEVLVRKIEDLGYTNIEYKTSEKTKGSNKLKNTYIYDVLKIAFSTIKESLPLTTLSLADNKGWPHYENMINEFLEDSGTSTLRAMVELTRLKSNKICKPYQQFVFAFILYQCMKTIVLERPIGVKNLDPGKINVYISEIINNWDDSVKEFLLKGAVGVYKDYVEGPKIIADLGAAYSLTDLPKHLILKKALRLEISISMIFLPRVSPNDPEYQEFLNKVGKILSNQTSTK